MILEQGQKTKLSQSDAMWTPKMLATRAEIQYQTFCRVQEKRIFRKDQKLPFFIKKHILPKYALSKWAFPICTHKALQDSKMCPPKINPPQSALRICALLKWKEKTKMWELKMVLRPPILARSPRLVREDLNRKKTFSFGHCPNPLTPPPDPNSGNLVLFFGRQIEKFKI